MHAEYPAWCQAINISYHFVIEFKRIRLQTMGHKTKNMEPIILLIHSPYWDNRKTHISLKKICKKIKISSRFQYLIDILPLRYTNLIFFSFFSCLYLAGLGAIIWLKAKGYVDLQFQQLTVLEDASSRCTYILRRFSQGTAATIVDTWWFL